MKYKIGDKVKIKTWDQMEKEYRCWGGIYSSEGKYIGCKCNFVQEMEIDINQNHPNRILIIRKKVSGDYLMEESEWRFSDDMIECLAEDYKESVPVNNRFEIMDFD